MTQEKDMPQKDAPGDLPRVREVRRSEDRFLGSDLFETDRRQLPPRNGAGTVADSPEMMEGPMECSAIALIAFS